LWRWRMQRGTKYCRKYLGIVEKALALLSGFVESKL
jgi:hypothetical protein